MVQSLKVIPEEPTLRRQPDSLETAEIVQKLRDSGQIGLLAATEPLARLTFGWHPPSKASVNSSSGDEHQPNRPPDSYDGKMKFLVG